MDYNEIMEITEYIGNAIKDDVSEFADSIFVKGEKVFDLDGEYSLTINYHNAVFSKYIKLALHDSKGKVRYTDSTSRIYIEAVLEVLSRILVHNSELFEINEHLELCV